MPYQTRIKRVCRPFLIGAFLSTGLLIWIAPNHRPSLWDFAVMVLLGLLFKTCLSVVNGIHAGINVFVICVLLGVAQPLSQQWKTIFPFGAMYIALIVSYIMSRSLYRFERLRLRLDLPEEVIIGVNDGGFDIVGRMMQANNTRYKSVTWSKVYRINAFKRDLFSYDLICLELSGK